MLIILEGPDGSGKTTLARKLCQENGFQYVHHGLYPDDTPQQLFERYTESILTSSGVVMDRCFLSEQVYGQVMRKEDRLGEIGQDLLTRLCQANGVTEVICLPAWGTVLDNWRNKKGDYVTKGRKLKQVYAVYDRLIKKRSHYVHYSYQWESGKTREQIAKASNTRSWMVTSPPWLPRGVVGNPQAKFLFVGDQVNTKKYWVDLPFFDLNGVSGFFHQALKNSGAKESDLAFINSLDSKGFDNPLEEVVKHFPNLNRVVALGKDVARRCEAAGVDYVCIPHPNYWMRFHSKETLKYVDKLGWATQ